MDFKLVRMTGTNIWAVIGDQIDFKGTLDEVRDLINCELAVKPGQFDMAIKTMLANGDTVAEFGLFGHFMYSQGTEERMAA